MQISLDGKVAIVTGGGRGIGAAACRAFIAAGAAVAIVDIDAHGLSKLVGELLSNGGKALAVVADLGDPDAVRDVVAQTVAGLGSIDILVNNAMATNLLPRDLAVAELDLEVWNQQLAVNLTAPMLLAKYAIPHMIARGGGSMVHIASAAALRAEDTRTGYGATKSALLALSRSIAVQYGKAGIRSNVVAPGLVLTQAALDCFPEAERKIFSDCHMTARMGTPDDVAAAILYLTSEHAAFVSGQILKVDGGFTAYLGAVPSLRQLAVLDLEHTQ